MRVKTPQVAWHGRAEQSDGNDAILSVDVHHTLTLATAGTDNYVRIWRLKPNGLDLFDEAEPLQHGNHGHAGSGGGGSGGSGGSGGGGSGNGNGEPKSKGTSVRPRPEDLTVKGATTTKLGLYNFAFSLLGHSRPVNVVRFSPNGECLASAGDDARVVLWRRNDAVTGEGWSWAAAESEREVQYKVFKGHLDDVYDLQWSPEGRFLVSGSIDNCAIVWDVRTGKCLQRIKEHAGYVQGVAWDPLNQFLATQSSDRTCRIYTSAQNARGEIFGPHHKGKWSDVKCRKIIRHRTACQIPPPTPRAPKTPKPAAKAAAAKAAAAKAAAAKAAAEAAAATPLATDAADKTTDPSTADDDAAEASAPPARGAADGAVDAAAGSDAAAAAADGAAGSAKAAEAGAAGANASTVNEAASTDAAAPAADTSDAGAKAAAGPGTSASSSTTTTVTTATTTTTTLSRHTMFMDETVPNFFRRLCFSPDGEFLFTPTGCFRSLDGDDDLLQGGSRAPHKAPATTTKFVPTTFMFCRGQWTNPAFHFPGPADASVAVRCCPRVLAYRSETKHNIPRVTQAAYRIVFAVATQTEVLVYDTQHWYPLCRFKDLHLAPISDIAWSPCGRLLAISSQDGYMTFVRFDENELGEAPAQEVLPAILRDTHVLPPIFGVADEPAAEAPAPADVAAVVATATTSSSGGSDGGSGSSSSSSSSAAGGGGGGGAKRIAPTPLSSDDMAELTSKRRSSTADDSGGLVSTAAGEPAKVAGASASSGGGGGNSTESTSAGGGRNTVAADGEEAPKKRMRITPMEVGEQVESTFP